MTNRKAKTGEALFEAASCGLAVVASDGMIQRANRTLLAWTGYEADTMVGEMRFQDLLTKPARMFYLTHIDPLLRMQGFVNEIACQLKCADGHRTSVYVNFAMEQEKGEPARIHISVFRGQDRAKYEDELRAAKARAEHLSAIVESSIDAIVSTDLQGSILSANAGFRDVFQYEPSDAIGRDLSELICPPDRSSEHLNMLDRARQKVSLRLDTVRLRRDTTAVDVSLTLSPIKNDFDEVIAISMIYRDVTERVRAGQHIDLLMHEVNHRSKNLLTVVQGVARQTARNTADIAEFVDRFSARLSAIAASHDLLVSRDWKGIELHELARKQLGYLGDVFESQVTLLGPPVEVNPRAAEAIGLALHELSTNAVKYGALTNAVGKVQLHWRLDKASGVFSLSWTEEGGPMVTPPDKQGFGSAVLGRMVPQSVNGTSGIDYPPHGIRYHLTARIDQVVTE